MVGSRVAIDWVTGRWYSSAVKARRDGCFPLIAFSCLPFGRRILSLSFNHGSTLCNLALNTEILAPLSLLKIFSHMLSL